MPELRLHPNIQFIYELVLAERELEAMGVKARVSADLRTFEAPSLEDAAQLRRRLAYFQTVDGELADYHHIQAANRTRSINQYLTHWIYPYKGKYHPQMIRAFFNILRLEPGATVLDPFIGSGTTAVEASLLGLRTIGVDVSPLCVLISSVKSQAVQVVDRLRDIRSQLWMQISAEEVERLSKDGDDPRVRQFFRLLACVTESDVARRGRDPHRSLVANLDRMLGSVEDFERVASTLGLTLGPAEIRQGDARRLELPDCSVDAVVTSPPYSIALDYVANDAHALEALGYDLGHIKQDFIGVRGTGRKRFQIYNDDMRQAYAEMFRVLKPGAGAVIVLGNVTLDGEEIDTTGECVRACRDAGFEFQGQIDKIIFGLYSIMQKEYVLFFRKP